MARSNLARSLVPMAAVALLALGWTAMRPDPEALVVYCAHDQVLAERIFDDFQRRTGIPVKVVYDTESTKSLALVERIGQEMGDPACDVFWNNEMLGTVDLAEKGALEPYQGTGWNGIPAGHRDPRGRWTGFAARMRVWLADGDRVPQDVDGAIEARLAQPDLSRIAIAKPLYGTTLTQYAALWKHQGPEWVKAWHTDWRRRGVREVAGNAQVMAHVAAGECDLGPTDTDDAFVALDRELDPKDNKKGVWMAPVLVADRTIVIPNTVSIVRGTRHLAAARRLVDYLLDPQVETQLANGPARQIPLGRVDPSQIPEEVRAMLPDVNRRLALDDLSVARADCLIWLKSLPR